MNINFDKVIGFYEKELNKGYNYRANKKYIKIMIKFIKEIHEDYPELDASQMHNVVYNEMRRVVISYAKYASCREGIVQSIICKELLSNDGFLEKEYNKIKDKEFSAQDADFSLEYDLKDIESLKKSYISSIVANLRMKENSKKHAIMLERYEKVRNRKDIFISNSDRKKMENCRALSVGTELERLKAFIEQDKNIVEDALKEKYINLMVNIGEFFKTFDLLDKYNAVNNIELRRIGLKELNYDVLESNSDKDAISVMDIFNEEKLRQYSLEELAMLNTFWQNRFAKDTKSINEAIFYITTLNLWDDVIKGNDINLDDEEKMDAIFLKNKIMEFIGREIMAEGQTAENRVEDDENEIAIYDVRSPIEKLNKKVGEKYKEYFDNILPQSKNSFREDIDASIILYSNIENIYYCKDSTLMSLLNTFNTSKKIKNWGYIKPKEKNDDKRYVLVGIDYEGFNMPLRVHMRKDDMIDSLNNMFGNSIIPIYEGEDDFIYRDKLIKTQILMPLDKKHKVAIRDMAKKVNSSDEKYKFIKHLDFLRKSDNFPEHLKSQEVNEKGIVTKKRKRMYIDISTGQKYEIDKKDYILISDEEGKNDETQFNGDSR